MSHLVDAPRVVSAARLEQQVLEADIAVKEPGHALRSLPVVALQDRPESDLQAEHR